MRSVNGKKTCVFLLLLALLVSGCGGPEAKSRPGDGSSLPSGSSMGRYMETFYEMPREINRNGGVNWLANGDLTVISFGNGLYRSADGGQTWEQEETNWFPLTQEVYCLAAVMGPDGTAAASCSGEMPAAVREVYVREVPEDWEGNYCVFGLPDGAVKIVDFGFRQEDGSCIGSFVFKEDGRLFAGDLQGKVYEVDPEREKVRELFMAEGGVGYLDFSGETLMAVGADRLYLYDLEQEKLRPQDETVDAYLRQALVNGTVSYTGGGYPVTVTGSPEEDVVYIAGEDGMYRHVLGGSVMEQVIDGALSTLGDTGSVLYRVKVLADQEFLAVFQPSVGLVHYRFDADIPSMPEQEIRIYSLREDRSIRQAVTVYKRTHPDIYVRYEVGLEQEGGMTEEDALKRLNTQVLAGEGPDVLLLDGLPMETYIEKGMLKDLRPVLDEEEALFSNIKESFAGTDGAIYTMPMCIRVPLLVGDRESLGRMDDLAGIAEETGRIRAGYPAGGIFGIYDPDCLLRLFGMVSSPAWTNESGQPDEGKIAEYLELVRQIYETELAGAVPEQVSRLEAEEQEMASYGTDVSEYRMGVCNNVLEIVRDHAMAAGGYVNGIQLCLDNVTSAVRGDETLDWRIFDGQAADPFLPSALVGISARTEQPEEAEDFVRLVFGADVQSGLYNGFPVNREAYEAHFDAQEDHGSNGSMLLAMDDGSEREFELYWPDQAEQEQFTDCVEQLRTPVMTDSYLCELVYENGVRVLKGEQSAEEGAAEIVRKASIYLAE